MFNYLRKTYYRIRYKPVSSFVHGNVTIYFSWSLKSTKVLPGYVFTSINNNRLNGDSIVLHLREEIRLAEQLYLKEHAVVH